jgi:hypothetical protein
MPSLGIAPRARCTTSETCTRGSRWRRSINVLPTSVLLPPLVIRIRAIRLSPYCANVAGPCHTRLLTSPAFQPCSCPLALSGLGKAVASESCTLNSGPLRGQFTPCVPWRTVSLHSAPQYSDADHAYQSGDTHAFPESSRHGSVHVTLVD